MIEHNHFSQHKPKFSIYIFLCCLLLSFGVKAQAPLWTKQLGGPGNEFVKSIKIDHNQKPILIGQFSDTLNFETNGNSSIIVPNGENSVYIQKRTVNGDLEWVKHIDSQEQLIEFEAIDIDEENNLYVTGWFKGSFTVDFGNGSQSISSNNYRAIVLKIAENGDLVWISTPMLPNNSMAYTIQVVGSSIVIGGRCNSDWNYSDFYLLKLDMSGQEIWTKYFSSLSWHEGSIESLDIDNHNNIVITGYYRGIADFDPSSNDNLNSAEQHKDVFVAKYSENGEFIWFKSIPSDIGLFGTNYDVAVDQNTNEIVVASGFNNNVDFDPGANQFTMSSPANMPNNFVLKLSSLGDFIWVKNIGGDDYDWLSDMELDSLGNIWMTGTFIGTVDFDPNLGVSTMTSIGFADLYVLNLDRNGYFVWCAAYTGNPFEGQMELALDQNGSCYVGGNYAGASTVDPNFNSYYLSQSNGGLDLFISKLNAFANVQDETILTKVHLFPNPANNSILIQSESVLNQIKIFNCLGQFIAELPVVNELIDVSGLQNGTYFIFIDGFSDQLKLVVNR